MPRSGAEARIRLREAALDLYGDQGYDATTTAQIAARAGVTERTFFRHFADKREVLFDDQGKLEQTLAGAALGAPDEATPLAALREAFVAAVPLFVAGRSVAERRADIIATAPALAERATAKSDRLVESLTAALVERGTSVATARLAARVGMAAFAQAQEAWSGRSGAQLTRLVDDAFADVRSLG